MFKFWELTAEWNVAGALAVPAFIGAVVTSAFISGGFDSTTAVTGGLVASIVFILLWNIIILLTTSTVALAGVALNTLGALAGYFISSILLGSSGSVTFSPAMNLALMVCIYTFLMLGVYVVLYAGAMYSQTQMVLQKAMEEQKKYEALNADTKPYQDLGPSPPELIETQEEEDGSKED